MCKKGNCVIFFCGDKKNMSIRPTQIDQRADCSTAQQVSREFTGIVCAAAYQRCGSCFSAVLLEHATKDNLKGGGSLKGRVGDTQ